MRQGIRWSVCGFDVREVASVHSRKYGCKGIADPFKYVKKEVGKKKEAIIELSRIRKRR